LVAREHVAVGRSDKVGDVVEDAAFLIKSLRVNVRAGENILPHASDEALRQARIGQDAHV